MVVIEQKWFYCDKNCCICAKLGLFGQKWLYSGKVVVFGQGGCILAKWLYSGKSVFNRAKCLYSSKWLYLGKNGCIWAKVNG